MTTKPEKTQRVHIVSARVSVETHQLLKKIAKDERRTVSNVALLLIERGAAEW